MSPSIPSVAETVDGTSNLISAVPLISSFKILTPTQDQILLTHQTTQLTLQTQVKKMRRWRGQVNHFRVDFRAISYEDNPRLSALLAVQLDPIMESLANSICDDRIITNNPTYVWVTNGDEIHSLNLRIRSHDTVGSNFLVSNDIRIVSVFTYTTFGPAGHALQPVR